MKTYILSKQKVCIVLARSKKKKIYIFTIRRDVAI
jgi:hypothetical protein